MGAKVCDARRVARRLRSLSPLDPNELEALYREVVLDHYRQPRHREPLEHVDAEASVDNPVCGDHVDVALKLDTDRVAAISVRTRGCSIAVAAGSVMAELSLLHSVDELARQRGELERILEGGGGATDVDARLRAFHPVSKLESRRACALLPWDALRLALQTATRSKM